MVIKRHLIVTLAMLISLLATLLLRPGLSLAQNPWFPEKVNANDEIIVQQHVYNECMKLYNGPAKREYCEWQKALAKHLYEPVGGSEGFVFYEYTPDNWDIADNLCRLEKEIFQKQAAKELVDQRAQQVIEVEEVKLILTHPGKPVKICNDVKFTAHYSFIEVGKKPHQFRREFKYPADYLVRFESSDNKGLMSIGPDNLQPASTDSNVTYMAIHNPGTFRALREGQYTVWAILDRNLPQKMVNFIKSHHPQTAPKILEALADASTQATVTVLPPTVKSVSITPSSVKLDPGEKFTFEDVVVTFKEACVKPRHLAEIKNELSWSSKIGNNNGNVYVAPSELQPDSLKVTCTSHPQHEVKACQTAKFKAVMSFKPAYDTVTATYKGVSSEPALVDISAPETRDVTHDPSVTWSTGESSFQVTEVKDYHVTTTHTPSDLSSNTVTLRVKPPTIKSLEVSPSDVKVNVGSQRQFTALAHYEEDCLTPKPLTLSDGLTWSTGKHGIITNDGIYEAKMPGSDTITASLQGKLSGKASITVPVPLLIIDPSEVRLTLGEEKTFTAKLQHYTDVTYSDNTVWDPSNVFKANECGTFLIKATYTHPETKEVGTKVAKVIVDVSTSECVAIRKRLADARDPEKDPEYRRLSLDWLKTRLNLLKEKKCDCGVKLSEDIFKKVVKVPKVSGKPAIKAKGAISAVGLTPSFVGGDPAPSDELKYTVQSQNPGPDKEVEIGSTVTLTIYGNATIPNVVGMPVQQAKDAISAVGLTPSPVGGDPAPSDELKYTVQSQSPPWGTEVEIGSEVTIKIYGDVETKKRADLDKDSQGDRCSRLLELHAAAFKANNISLCRSVLDQARDCPFYARELAAVKKKVETSEELRNIERCSKILDAITAASKANDLNRCGALLAQATDCSYYADLYAAYQADLENRRRHSQQRREQFATLLGSLVGTAIKTMIEEGTHGGYTGDAGTTSGEQYKTPQWKHYYAVVCDGNDRSSPWDDTFHVIREHDSFPQGHGYCWKLSGPGSQADCSAAISDLKKQRKMMFIKPR